METGKKTFFVIVYFEALVVKYLLAYQWTRVSHTIPNACWNASPKLSLKGLR